MSGRFGVELAVVVLACVGLWVTVDKVVAGVVRVWGWLVRDRVAPLLEDSYEDGDELEELPPERSAADLGFGGPSPRIRAWLERDDPAEDDGPDGCVVPSSPESASAALAMRTGIGAFSTQRERRAPWWEAEHRAAYESLGFDYPSGLMERVRELTT